MLLVTLPAAIACLLLAGCEDGYDVSILYTPRTDWLVVESLKDVVPTRYDPPGMLPLETLDNPNTSLFGPNDGKLLLAKKGTAILDPRVLSSSERGQLVLALRDLAGRPARPKIDISGSGDKFVVEEKGNRVPINSMLQMDLKLDSKTLEDGSVLYRTNCLHCHGLDGDGRGPTGHWINPHPRDYRQGIFKFASSAQTTNRKPRRDDLKRVLINGIEGTTMPSFHLLKDEELEAIVSYIIHLSIRGEVEFAVLQDLIREKEQGASDEPMILRVRTKADEIARSWLEAQKTEIKPVKPPEYKSEDERLASASRGYKVYSDKNVACAGCHLNYGRDAAFRYDAWGTIVKPRNFFQNMYRGGRRPIEVYWRIAGGINGADMAPFAKNPAAITPEEDQQIWDLISFLNILPYPEKRQELKDKYGIVVE